jgi:hypothetical protein
MKSSGPGLYSGTLRLTGCLRGYFLFMIVSQ